MELAIEVSDLTKAYGENEVLHSISFNVKKGEIFGLLGINGAGKTTTLECLEGLLSYQAGQVRLHGTIGVQLQSTSLPEEIRAKEALELFARWNRVKLDWILVERLGITNFQNKVYKELSTGQKRRLHLALSLIQDPDILFLDEPTAGLDVEGRIALHEEIRSLKRRGKTIIMSSHDMAEVEELCDTIGVLRGGRLAFIGTPQEMTVTIKDSSKIYLYLSSSLSGKEFLYCSFLGCDHKYQVFESSHLREGLLELLQMISKENISLIDMKLERVSLEERFLALSKEEEEVAV